MTGRELDIWSAHSRAGFAEQQVASGLRQPAEARADAERLFAELLPEGLDTPLHHLWTVRESGVTVGHLWLQVRPLSTEVEAFLYDVELVATARGRGLGRATMLAAEDAARAWDATVMRLNVFGHNTPALRLYASLGYDVVDVALTRRLDSESMTTAGDADLVTLRDSTPEQYRSWRPRVERERAEGLVRAGALPATEAGRRAADDLARLLPRGRTSPGHRLWTAYDGGDEPIGTVWLEVVRRSDGSHALLHALTGGLGVVDAILRAADDLRLVGVEVSAFGFDESGRADYRRAGFTLTAQTMVKRLTSPESPPGPREEGVRQVGSPR